MKRTLITSLLASALLFGGGCSDDFDEIRLFERWDPVRGYMVQYWPYGEGAHSLQNPYWIQNRMNRETSKRRYMLNASLRWNITDWMNVSGRGRGGLEQALRSITARTLVVGITTDIIFTPAEMRSLHAMIPGSAYHEIDSPFGHDGFLVEHEQLNDILLPFMNN